MRLFVEPADCLFGDTLMQTPALRALRAANPGAEIVYVAPPGSLAELALRGNPAIDRFASEGSGRVLSSWNALDYAIKRHVSFYEGFAAQLGVSIPSKAVDFHLTEGERKAGEALIESFGPPHKVVVCGRHSTSCTASRFPGSPPNKCFSNEVWVEVAEWLIEIGYVPLAVGAAEEAADPRFDAWPGPRLYGHPLREVAALIERAKATFCVDTGLRFLAAAIGCDLACVSGQIPLWLISCVPTQPGQTVVERQCPPSAVTVDLCKELVWKVL